MQRAFSLSRAGSVLLLLAALPLASCDGGSEPTSVTFGDVVVNPVGGATLAVVNGALVVSDVPEASDGGLWIDGTHTRVDVEIDPLTLPTGARFGGQAETAGGSAIASMFAEGLPNNQIRLAFSFASASAVTRVRVLYKLNDRVVFEIPALTLTQTLRRGAALAAEGTAGTGEGKAGSVHVIRDGGRYIVVSDSEGSSTRSSGAAGGCAGYTILPPAVADLPPPDGPLCVDWVEVQPLDGQAAQGGRTSILARGVGRFTVRSLGVR